MVMDSEGVVGGVVDLQRREKGEAELESADTTHASWRFIGEGAARMLSGSCYQARGRTKPACSRGPKLVQPTS